MRCSCVHCAPDQPRGQAHSVCVPREVHVPPLAHDDALHATCGILQSMPVQPGAQAHRLCADPDSVVHTAPFMHTDGPLQSTRRVSLMLERRCASPPSAGLAACKAKLQLVVGAQDENVALRYVTFPSEMESVLASIRILTGKKVDDRVGTFMAAASGSFDAPMYTWIPCWLCERDPVRKPTRSSAPMPWKMRVGSTGAGSPLMRPKDTDKPCPT
jgi:hypothetical protein